LAFKALSETVVWSRFEPVESEAPSRCSSSESWRAVRQLAGVGGVAGVDGEVERDHGDGPPLRHDERHAVGEGGPLEGREGGVGRRARLGSPAAVGPARAGGHLGERGDGEDVDAVGQPAARRLPDLGRRGLLHPGQLPLVVARIAAVDLARG
jgi:hypothetical protein